MNHRRLLARGLPAAALLAAALAAAPAAASVVVYVVRHAEKGGAPGDRDPALSTEGLRRADDLARTLRSVKLSGVYATQFKRTQQTVAPAAAAAKVEITMHPAGKESELAAKVRATREGAVLIAGHSNTVPAILEALGAKEKITLSEADYDDLFVVVIDDEGAATLLHLHYGLPSP